MSTGQERRTGVGRAVNSRAFVRVLVPFNYTAAYCKQSSVIYELDDVCVRALAFV